MVSRREQQVSRYVEIDDPAAALENGWRDFIVGPGGVGETIPDADLERVERGEARLETKRFYFGGLFSSWLFRVSATKGDD